MNFTAIPNDIMTMDLSDGAFRLYCLLQSYCYGEKNSCFPSQKTLADRLNRSVRTIQRYIGELVSLNLIKVIRKGSMNNHYEILHKVANRASEAAAKKHAAEVGKNIRQKYEDYKKQAKSNFNNFQQRSYNMPMLESLLLKNNSGISYEDCLAGR